MKQWSLQEKEKLNKLIKQLQTNKRIDWQKISTLMENRTAQQCKLQYRNVLSINKEAILNYQWTHEEGLKLLELVLEYGTQWKFIQLNYFVHLTSEQIRLKYYYLKANESQYLKMFEKEYQFSNKDMKLLSIQLQQIELCRKKLDQTEQLIVNNQAIDPLDFKIYGKDTQEKRQQLQQEEIKIMQLIHQFSGKNSQ
ncbi:Myb-like_DNA-binding domain-containing protein [Hexamita inflata]|uniref:Myb-like DNA-binding domain-containing protein n=1 Tax=Hexamita inflata TaxID=28002 RepID=A0AA86PE39_9EUKA|nr:Myb-like DNA-binding domain-containing protein [Hexamita inflata]